MCRFILNYYEISFFTFLDLYSLPFPFIHNHLSFYDPVGCGGQNNRAQEKDNKYKPKYSTLHIMANVND